MFIDTQALRQARFDWNGRLLSKLTEFAKRNQLRLMTTEVTVREVKSQLQEVLSEVASSLTKHSGILGQLGAKTAADIAGDPAAALKKLEAAFSGFLRDTNALTVPLASDVKGLLDDYFSRRPPFSSKKKAEFPDAITIASIRAWCQQTASSVYIVSGDSDLKACCSESGPLYYVPSVLDLITRATVSQELHDALEKALRDSDELSDELADQIKYAEVEWSRSFGGSIEDAKIVRVNDIHIVEVDVLEQNKQAFTCEISLDADIELDVDVYVESQGYLPDDYEPSRTFSISFSKTSTFYAEVIVRFDPVTSGLEFESVHVGSHPVRLDFDDLHVSRRW